MILSIIIPSFQLGHEMAGALESIRSQNFFDYEIVIVDGCSTDSTVEVVNAAADLPIRFVQEPDKGVYDAMNKGIMLAQGQWLYFMGGDDRLIPGVLHLLLPHFANEELDVFYGNVQLASNNEQYDGEFDLLKLVCKGNICHQAIFYHKTVFNKIGNYNLRYKVWGDWDLNIRCFKHMGLAIEYVNTLVARYNNESGVSATYDPIFCQELPAYYLERIAILEQQNKNLLTSASFIVGNKVIKLLHKTGLNKLFKNDGKA